MAQQLVLLDSNLSTASIFGTCDENARRIEGHFGVHISNRQVGGDAGDALLVEGENKSDVERAARVIKYLSRMVDTGGTLSEQSVDYVIAMVTDGAEEELGSLENDVICVTTRGKPIKPRTVGQKKYVEAIKKNTIVLGVGPAGTGKTFLAVAMAVDALRAKQIDRIVLTRPAVEAGEKLGFLPGDLQNKIDPYLRPLNDALFEMLGAENYARQVEKNAIEIAPLAYMRGRTLDDSFIILDEAQNTTPEQMKMFLTRIGFGSRAVITGDVTQIDLPDGKRSGLKEAMQVVQNLEDISVCTLDHRDVVRHELVSRIIKAYEKYDEQKQKNGQKDREKRKYHVQTKG